MKTDKEIRSMYKTLEGKLESKKDSLYSEFVNSNEERKNHISYEIDMIDNALDKLYETCSLWASDLADNDDTLKIIKDIKCIFFG